MTIKRRIENIPITPTIKYVTSSAAHIKGIKLRNTKVALKKTVLSFSMRDLFPMNFELYSCSWNLILLRARYVTKDRKERTNIANEPITANH